MSIFTLEGTDGDARAGVLHTGHGSVPTPAFMPVATQGSVKALDPDDLRRVGARIVLANAYHLYLRPGIDRIAGLGGLHAFMAWNGPILTDSGGFQGFSLERLREVTEEAIVFKSHIDGNLHRFSPEAAVEYQEKLGADIVMPLDICVASDSDRATVAEAVARTSRWALRSRAAHSLRTQALFGIVQGGLFPDLREESAAFMTSLGFPGYALGGLSVGESKEETYSTVACTSRLLPAEAPRYLMGVGAPEDLVECVARGIDLFDCVLPTRLARNGALLVRGGSLNIESAPFGGADAPIEPGCDCYTCRTFSAAYVHHLFRARELLAYRLATIHNLRFVLRLMEEIRAAILAGTFDSYRRGFVARSGASAATDRTEQKRKWLQAQERLRATRTGGFP